VWFPPAPSPEAALLQEVTCSACAGAISARTIGRLGFPIGKPSDKRFQALGSENDSRLTRGLRTLDGIPNGDNYLAVAIIQSVSQFFHTTGGKP